MTNGQIFSDCLLPEVISLMNDTLAKIEANSLKVEYSPIGLSIRYFEEICKEADAQGKDISQQDLWLLKDVCDWIGREIHAV